MNDSSCASQSLRVFFLLGMRPCPAPEILLCKVWSLYNSGCPLTAQKGSAAHSREFGVNLFLAINSPLTDDFLGKPAIKRQFTDHYVNLTEYDQKLTAINRNYVKIRHVKIDRAHFLVHFREHCQISSGSLRGDPLVRFAQKASTYFRGHLHIHSRVHRERVRGSNFAVCVLCTFLSVVCPPSGRKIWHTAHVEPLLSAGLGPQMPV